MSKILDAEFKGNVVRLYCGDDSLETWCGDDWDDTPYEHNAGTVYEKYVEDIVDVALPFDVLVSEPCDGAVNSEWSKYDMREGRVPLFVVLSTGEVDEWRAGSFAACIETRGARRVYMGDDAKSTLLMLMARTGAVVF